MMILVVHCNDDSSFSRLLFVSLFRFSSVLSVLFVHMCWFGEQMRHYLAHITWIWWSQVKENKIVFLLNQITNQFTFPFGYHKNLLQPLYWFITMHNSYHLLALITSFYCSSFTPKKRIRILNLLDKNADYIQTSIFIRWRLQIRVHQARMKQLFKRFAKFETARFDKHAKKKIERQMDTRCEWNFTNALVARWFWTTLCHILVCLFPTQFSKDICLRVFFHIFWSTSKSDTYTSQLLVLVVLLCLCRLPKFKSTTTPSQWNAVTWYFRDTAHQPFDLSPALGINFQGLVWTLACCISSLTIFPFRIFF